MPDGFPRLGIELDDPGERVVQAVDAVGEEQDVAVGQHRAVVLVAPGGVLMRPLHLAGLAVDHHDGVQAPEAQHHAAVVKGKTGVGVGELVPAAGVAELPPVQVQVAPRVPFPDGVARGRDFPHVVAVGDTFVLAAGVAALDARLDIRRHRFPADVDGVAVGASAEVVVLCRVGVLPDHFPVPGVFPQKAALAAPERRPRVLHPAGPEQVACREEIRVVPRTQRKRPLVEHLATHADEVCLA